jgi:L-fuconate dehydratase
MPMFDLMAVCGSTDSRWIEYVNRMHGHFLDAALVAHGRYLVPESPGYSGQLRPETFAEFDYPGGRAWRRPDDRAASAPSTVSITRGDA